MSGGYGSDDVVPPNLQLPQARRDPDLRSAGPHPGARLVLGAPTQRLAWPALGEDGALWWALALGADLGGNATLVGASAHVVIVGIAARNGLHISFVQWLSTACPPP